MQDASECGTLMALMVLQYSHVNKEFLMQYTEGHKEVISKA